MRKRASGKGPIASDGNPLDDLKLRAAVRDAIADAGLPLNERAANRLIDRIGDAIRPAFAKPSDA